MCFQFFYKIWYHEHSFTPKSSTRTLPCCRVVSHLKIKQVSTKNSLHLRAWHHFDIFQNSKRRRRISKITMSFDFRKRKWRHSRGWIVPFAALTAWCPFPRQRRLSRWGWDSTNSINCGRRLSRGRRSGTRISSLLRRNSAGDSLITWRCAAIHILHCRGWSGSANSMNRIRRQSSAPKRSMGSKCNIDTWFHIYIVHRRHCDCCGGGILCLVLMSCHR